MLANVGLFIAIVLLVYLIIKGVDMISATVLTSIVVLLTSQLNVWEGLFKTFSEGIGGFVASWFLILGLGGIFGQLVLEAGLASKIAKSLSRVLGEKMVGLVILICTFFITLLGINGYIMVFVLFPIADNLLKQNKMDRRVLPFLLLGGGACANGFAFSLDICNVIPSRFFNTSLGSAPVLSFIFTVVLALWYFFYFNHAQKVSREKYSEAELLEMYKEQKTEEENLPGLGISLLPFIVVLGAIVVTRSLDTSISIAASLSLGIVIILATQFKRIKNVKSSIKTGSGSGLSSMLTVAAVMGLSKVLGASPAFQNLQQAVLHLQLPMYIKAFFGTSIITGLTGSAISGETIFMESFGQAFVDMGANVGALHRIVTESALVLNKLPNSSVAILTMTICGCSLKESYKHVIVGTIVPAFIAGLLISILASLGFIF